jgi:hypothetical protein
MGRQSAYSRLCLIGLFAAALLSGCCGNGEAAVLYEDSFDNPKSGWGEDDRDEFERGYDRDEAYYFELYEPNWFAWATPGTRHTDVRVQVDARVISEVQDAHYGVICRYVDVDNFYYFAVSADGYYGIFRREDGDIDVLSGDGSGMMFSPTIKTGEQVNRIVAICQGSDLKLYANGGLLASVTDDTHTKGDVGLGAGRGTEGRVRVHFDGFVVTAP